MTTPTPWARITRTASILPQLPKHRRPTPEYVNPHNEIWLDIRTDIVGSGTSHTTVPFTFTDRRPGSIVVQQATQTSTALDHVGEAGAPIACLTLSTVRLAGGDLRRQRKYVQRQTWAL